MELGMFKIQYCVISRFPKNAAQPLMVCLNFPGFITDSDPVSGLRKWLFFGLNLTTLCGRPVLKNPDFESFYLKIPDFPGFTQFYPENL